MTAFAVGDFVVHLAKGLGRVAAIKSTEGESSLVVEVGREALWIPIKAWREHLRAIPTRAQGEAFRARASAIATPRPATGAAAATRRLRTLAHHDFDAKVTALCEAYACGDRELAAVHALVELEAHLLPIFVLALSSTPDTLRAELRAAMPPAAPTARPEALPDLGARFEPLCRATLTARTRCGDPNGGVPLATKPGTWFGYCWSATAGRERAVLVAIHADHAAEARGLLAVCEVETTTGTDVAKAIIYAEEIAGDEAARDEAFDEIEHGSVAGRGFVLSIGGDGCYPVRTATRDDVVVCIVAGNELDALETRLICGQPPGAAAIAALAAWREARIADAKRKRPRAKVGTYQRDAAALTALAVLRELPPTADGVAELERVAAIARPISDDVMVETVTLLARDAPAPTPWFTWLVDALQAGPAYQLGGPIERVLEATTRPELGDLVLDRYVPGADPWSVIGVGLLRALARGKHPRGDAMLRAAWREATTPWRRAVVACAVLDVDAHAHEVARGLVDMVEDFSSLDTSGDRSHAGYGRDWDEVCDAMTRHAEVCATCRRDWVVQLFRVKRGRDDAYRRLVIIAPKELERLTGATSDDALWAWLSQN